MRTIMNKIKKAHRCLFDLHLIFIATTLFAITQVSATETNITQHLVSQGALKKNLTEQKRQHIIEMNKLSKKSDQVQIKLNDENRKLALNKTKQAKSNLPSQSRSHDIYADFEIYSASSILQGDYDADGFYHTFSVIFDADIYSYSANQVGEVYALLYISRNGGPWNHFFTTETFLIEGETDLDEYEVITTFLSGYESDHYDVLIDLYQVGYSDIVATYSSDDSNALYALPLESSDYDEPYIEPYVEVVEINGGSVYWVGLLLLAAWFVRKRA